MRRLALVVFLASITMAPVYGDMYGLAERYYESLPSRVLYWTDEEYWNGYPEMTFMTTVTQATAPEYHLHVPDLYTVRPDGKPDSYNRAPISWFYHFIPLHDNSLVFVNPDGRTIVTSDNGRPAARTPVQIVELEANIERFSELAVAYAETVIHHRAAMPFWGWLIGSALSGGLSALMWSFAPYGETDLEIAGMFILSVAYAGVSVGTAVAAVAAPIAKRAREREMKNMEDQILAVVVENESRDSF